MKLPAFLRRLLRARPAERPSERFFDERAKALGPKGVDVDRQFRKP